MSALSGWKSITATKSVIVGFDCIRLIASQALIGTLEFFLLQIEFETFSLFGGGVVDFHGDLIKISKICGLQLLLWGIVCLLFLNFFDKGGNFR
jgi:hypothetical protein